MIRFIFIASLLIFSCSKKNIHINTSIIPKPVSQTINNGVFNLAEKIEIIYDSSFVNEVEYLKSNFPILPIYPHVNLGDKSFLSQNQCILLHNQKTFVGFLVVM